MSFKRITSFISIVFCLFTNHALALPINLIEFNTWGVPLVVKDTFRYRIAMREIEKISPDFVVLAEVFSAKGKRAFHSPDYPYEVRGPRAFPKLVSSGLRVLSKHRILRSAQTQFCHCVGDDCLSKKGAVILVAKLPNGQNINVLATHLNSRGGDEVRIDQIKQLKLLIDTYSDPDAPLIIAGDFNFNPQSPAYTYMMDTIQGRDAWTDTHTSADPGYTYDTDHNHYARDYSIQTNAPLINERVDLILSRSSSMSMIQTLGSRVIFNEAPLLSDHYGLLAEFDLN